jgi:hypothetical protein
LCRTLRKSATGSPSVMKFSCVTPCSAMANAQRSVNCCVVKKTEETKVCAHTP